MNSITVDYLYDVKDKIPENIYIQLMNNLKKDMEIKEKKKNKTVKINYLQISTCNFAFYDSDDDLISNSKTIHKFGTSIWEVVENDREGSPFLQKTKISDVVVRSIKAGIKEEGGYLHGKDNDSSYFILKCEEIQD